MKIIIAHQKESIFLIIFLLFCFPLAPCFAESSINARYQSITNKRIVFLVEVGNPAPASLIVSHSHPSGNRLISASPAATKISHKSGTSKWLLKNVKPGVYPFSLSFNNPVNPNAVSLMISFRDTASGTMRELIYRP